ncbi:unnamed protein product, partial [Owenia fusiformis]
GDTEQREVFVDISAIKAAMRDATKATNDAKSDVIEEHCDVNIPYSNIEKFLIEPSPSNLKPCNPPSVSIATSDPTAIAKGTATTNNSVTITTRDVTPTNNVVTPTKTK